MQGEKVPPPFIDALKSPIVVASRNGTVLEANASFCGLVGLDRDSVIGSDCRNIELLDKLYTAVTAVSLEGEERSERIINGSVALEATVIPMSDESGRISQVCIQMTDISSLVNLEQETERKNREMIITSTLSSAFIASDDIDAVFQELLDMALMVTGLSMGWIMLFQDSFLSLKCSRGLSSDLAEAVGEGGLEHIYDSALSSGEPLRIIESGDAADIKGLKGENISFLAIIPLRVGDSNLGLIALANLSETSLDFDMASLLSLVGNNISLIADKIRLFQETQRLAITDGLTGIYNARHFYVRLDEEVARTERYAAPFSLVLFDIDDFKIINDKYGHQAGDEVLRSVAQIMLRMSRKTDVVARYGGEEFITILPSTPKQEAYHLACRIKDAFEQESFLGKENVRLSISGGVATFPEDAQNAKSLMYAADMAMYKAKADGKRLVRCYEKELDDKK